MYPHPGNEGQGSFVAHQVEQLRSLRHQVEVLHFRGYRSKLEYLKAALEVRRRTRSQVYDIVHAHYGVTALPALFRCGTPLVVTFHGSDVLRGWIEPLVSRFVCRFADATIAVSKKIAERIPSEIIPCGVDLRVFEPKGREKARARLGLSRHKQYVLFPFDPLRKVKRFDLASGAVGALAQDGLDVELLTVSNAPNHEMPWYYSAANAMILCSDSEASPTSVKEALACDLPVVSTDVGDVAEIVHGIPGIQFCSQTVRSLAHGLRAALTSPSGPAFKSRHFMSRYSQQQIAHAILRVYDRVMKNQRSNVPPAPTV